MAGYDGGVNIYAGSVEELMAVSFPSFLLTSPSFPFLSFRGSPEDRGEY